MEKLKTWLSSTPYARFHLSLASADASFRKYYRLRLGDESVLVMDASLEKESLLPFLDVTKRLHEVGVRAPHVHAKNLEAGYLIIEDFGSEHYLDLLNEANFHTLYAHAIDTIAAMQQADATALPPYDKAYLHFEMDLMQEWYLEKLLAHTLSPAQKELIARTLEHISQEVLAQPQGLFVHRDFHSRNIMACRENPGIIDYQDAMSGALTYDLVSLLKDCYIRFPREEIIKLALSFRDKKALDVDDATFIRWFDFTGLQRHIKVLGIFSRLYLRDAKEGYLKDIPLTLGYAIEAAKRYDATREFAELLEKLNSKPNLTVAL